MRKQDWNPLTGERRHVVATMVALACAAAAFAGPYVSLAPTPAGVPWPPTGVVLVALLVLGYDIWPAAVAGLFAGALLRGAPAAVAAIVAIAATAEGFAGAWLANRFACGAESLDRTRCFVRFVIVAGFVAAAVGPALGFPAFALIGRAPAGPAAAAALTWWLGDAASTLVVAPCLLLWTADDAAGTAPRRLAETVALVAALGVTWFTLFSGWLPASVAHYPLEVLCVPALLWAAYRFGPRLASLSVAGLAAVALGGTLTGAGPFALASGLASRFVLEAFVGVVAVTTIALATVTRERRSAEQRLVELARTDGLTGLANFRALADALDAEVARAMRRGHSFALLFLDLDRLKELNDTLGHLAGNRALMRIASALRVNSRSIDTAARIGGDEFCLLLPAANEADATGIAERVRQTLAVPWHGPCISASCGIALYPRDGATSEQLLGAADALLYGAKARRAEVPPYAGVFRAELAE